VARTRQKETARTRLAAVVQGGGITLVLGAGVSLELGVPNWRGLALTLWRAVKLTKKERAAVEKLANEAQSLPMLFELAERRLGLEKFVEALRSAIYADAARGLVFDDTGTTLGTIAQTISNDHRLGAQRRIARVVTFNADELLREALRRRRGERGQYWRTEDHAAFDKSEGRGAQPVPIYHVHGFLPRGGAFVSFSEHRLVFTDSQYWDSGTSQASLANRTMNAALADSRCVFIGLSMTDPNLLRWLGLRYNEIARDTREQARRIEKAGASSPFGGPVEPETIEAQIHSRLSGHFWIRTPDDDPTGLLSEFLAMRGVEAVEIASWKDDSFEALFRECFGPTMRR
jgi:hypothetical protein